MIISICAILSFFAVGIADNTGPTTTVRTTTGPTTVRTTIGLTNFMKTSTFKTTRLFSYNYLCYKYTYM